MAIKTWKELLHIIDSNIDPAKVVLTQISVYLDLPDGRKVVLPIRADSTIESLKASVSPPSAPKKPPNPVATPPAPKITATIRKFMQEFFDESDSEFAAFAVNDERAREFFKNTPNPIDVYEKKYTDIEGLTDLERFKNFLYQMPNEQTEAASQSPTEPMTPPKPGLTLTNKKKAPEKGPSKKTKKQ